MSRISTVTGVAPAQAKKIRTEVQRMRNPSWLILLKFMDFYFREGADNHFGKVFVHGQENQLPVFLLLKITQHLQSLSGAGRVKVGKGFVKKKNPAFTERPCGKGNPCRKRKCVTGA
jgi:hypothetical protein